jgi:hypothetical protein
MLKDPNKILHASKRVTKQMRIPKRAKIRSPRATLL